MIRHQLLLVELRKSPYCGYINHANFPNDFKYAKHKQTQTSTKERNTKKMNTKETQTELTCFCKNEPTWTNVFQRLGITISNPSFLYCFIFSITS